MELIAAMLQAFFEQVEIDPASISTVEISTGVQGGEWFIHVQPEQSWFTAMHFLAGNWHVAQLEYFPAIPTAQEGRLRAYQLNLFDRSLTSVPRYQIGRDIRVTHADWQEDNGKEGTIRNVSAYEDVAYIVDVEGRLEVFYEREVRGI